MGTRAHDAAMISFAVSEVEPGKLQPALERDAAVRSLLGGRVEAMSASAGRLVSCTDVHALVQAAHDAFYEHLPLVLSPDAVWLCLAQGFARHVNSHAEELRRRFVAHDGREKLVVEHTGIVLGRPSPWDEAFALFSDALAARLGKLRDLVVADFTTTGPIERAASQITLMDAFQGYFEYELRAGCGIPSITLTGTVDDWRSLRRRAAVFSEYGLSAWTDVLLPVLDRIVDTAAGTVDVEFWRSFFRHRSSSGPSQLTGWIVTLFPYLDDLTYARGRITGRTPVWNPHLVRWRDEHAHALDEDDGWPSRIGPELDQLPSGLASAPVRVVDLRTGEATRVRFVGGPMGVLQDPSTLALEPDVGWAVVHDG